MKISNKLLRIALVIPFLVILVVIIYLRLAFNSAVRDAGDNPTHYSDEIITSKYDFNEFSRLKFRGDWQIAVTSGDDYQITVIGPEYRVEALNIEKRGDQLRLTESIFRKGGPRRLEIEISMPELTQLSADGMSKIYLYDFTAKELEIDLKGAGRLIGDGNNIIDLELSCAGGIDIDLANSEITNADINLVGASKAELNMAGGELTGHVTGASSVTYYGDVRVQDVRTTGGSSVRKK
ncbi:MAG: DUF2807 domain-containing protein [Candidatus Neomarinimicrobiota bacterium]